MPNKKSKKSNKSATKKKKIIITSQNIEQVFEGVKEELEVTKRIKLTLTVGDLKFETQSDNFGEALVTLKNDSFGKLRTWGIITLEADGKKAGIRLSPIQIKRAFLGRFAQELLIKRLFINLK